MENEEWTEHARRIMRIVGLLRSQPSSIGEITKHIGQSQWRTYQYLMEMKEKGWAMKMIQDPKNPKRVLWKLHGSGSRNPPDRKGGKRLGFIPGGLSSDAGKH